MLIIYTLLYYTCVSSSSYIIYIATAWEAAVAGLWHNDAFIDINSFSQHPTAWDKHNTSQVRINQCCKPN